MAIYYCDYINGNDTTGDGSYSTPYKTITVASTSRNAGDEIRVAKSPEPTALTGTLAFTLNSNTVSGTNTLFTSEVAYGDFVEDAQGLWWEVVNIVSDTTMYLNRVFGGTTQSGTSSRKLGITSTGAAAAQTTTIQAVSSSDVFVSGGWDLSTQTQTGQTFFRQMHSTIANRYGHGLVVNTKAGVTTERLHFLRYYNGMYVTGGGKRNTFHGPIVLSSGSYGIYLSTYYTTITDAVCSSNTSDGIGMATYSTNTINGAICMSNGNNGISMTSNSGQNTLINCVCNRNGSYGFNINGCEQNTLVNPTAKSNGVYGLYITASYNTRVYGTLTTSGNPTGSIYIQRGWHWIQKAVCSETTKLTFGTSLTNTRAHFDSLNGVPQIHTDLGYIICQDATAGGTGKEWKMAVGHAFQDIAYPLVLKIATVAVTANSQVTITCYFKKSSATGLGAIMRCRAYQIEGLTSDAVATCPNDTNRNQLQIQFTPTETGVIEVEAIAYYVSVSSSYVLIDDISITQA